MYFTFRHINVIIKIMETSPNLGKSTPESTPTPFEAAAVRLFSTLNQRLLETGDRAFFKVVWESVDPIAIQEVTLATLEPTGALRQEEKGTFGRSQFKINEFDESSKPLGTSFIWCRTDRVRPGETAVVDEEELLSEYGFRKLSFTSVAETLRPFTEEVEDFKYLIAKMTESNEPPSKLFAKRVSSYLYRTIDDTIAIDPTSFDSVERQQSFLNLMKYINAQSPDLARPIHGRIVSKLLRAITLRSGKSTEEFEQMQNNALELLGLSLSTGALPREDRLLGRIFTTWQAYRVPIVVESLYERMNRKIMPGGAKSIFSTKREIFAHEFIHGTIDARIRELDAEGHTIPGIDAYKNFLSLCRTTLFSEFPINYSDFFRLATFRGFVQDEIPEQERGLPKTKANSKHELRQLVRAYEHVITELASIDKDRPNAIPAFKYQSILSATLEPRINRSQKAVEKEFEEEQEFEELVKSVQPKRK